MNLFKTHLFTTPLFLLRMELYPGVTCKILFCSETLDKEKIPNVQPLYLGWFVCSIPATDDIKNITLKYYPTHKSVEVSFDSDSTDVIKAVSVVTDYLVKHKCFNGEKYFYNFVLQWIRSEGTTTLPNEKWTVVMDHFKDEIYMTFGPDKECMIKTCRPLMKNDEDKTNSFKTCMTNIQKMVDKHTKDVATVLDFAHSI